MKQSKWWTWNGNKLANPLLILVRLLSLPLMIATRVVLCMLIAAGWGWDRAVDMWEMTD